MNAKTAKIIRKFAEVEKLDYTGCKNYFQSGDVKLQALHLEMMRRVIVLKGGENMANQKLCDRPDKTIIGPDDDYLPLKVKQPDGQWLDVDLCSACAQDFKAFLNQAPARTSVQQEQPAPAAPAEQPQAAQPELAAAQTDGVDPNPAQ